MKFNIIKSRDLNWNNTIQLAIGYKSYFLGVIGHSWGIRICFIFFQIVIHYYGGFGRPKK